MSGYLTLYLISQLCWKLTLFNSVNFQHNCFSNEKGRILTYWFDLGSVQFPPVEHDGVDGVTCPGSLDGSWENIQEILEEKMGGMIIKSNGWMWSFTMIVSSRDFSWPKFACMFRKCLDQTATLSNCPLKNKGKKLLSLITSPDRSCLIPHWTLEVSKSIG